MFAGILAPVVLLLVAFLPYLYKRVYTEVVEALPLNGGTYNCLLGFASIPADYHVLRGNLGTLPVGQDLFVAVALCFSAALLGISGFESSANFVEEQDVGVFRKTLRNMLIAVTIFNPLISVLSLNLFPLDEILRHQDYLLSEMAHLIGGQMFKMVIVLDATALPVVIMYLRISV